MPYQVVIKALRITDPNQAISKFCYYWVDVNIPLPDEIFHTEEGANNRKAALAAANHSWYGEYDKVFVVEEVIIRGG